MAQPEASEGRFTYGQLFDYISQGVYPESFLKEDKQALRKRAKFFTIDKANLYYIGGPGKLPSPIP